MQIDLPDDLGHFVGGAVRAGLYEREEDVIRDALALLKRSMPAAVEKPTGGADAGRRAEPVRIAVTPEELNRRLFAAGLITRLPDPTVDVDDGPPVEIEGEALSETIIRERR